MNEAILRKKHKRLTKGERPRVLDLFSGCGGLSLGFHSAGSRIEAAVEFDTDSARSHGMNFHKGEDKFSQARDITDIKPANLTEQGNRI